MGADVGRNGIRDALPVGSYVGTYQIESVLGQGGFGIVYKARHLDLNTIVAIKEYLPIEIAVREGHTVYPRSRDFVNAFEDSMDRFLGEAKHLSEFQHDPAVVSCLDFFRTNGTAYLVMKHEEGMPLSQLLERREADGNPFGEAELLSVIEPFLEGLFRVHKSGILHRDIKPSNILIRLADDRPVLIDFGAAKQTVTLQTKSLAPYTEGYAAIEQVGDGDLGTWTDLYGVGAVMWRMVAGGNPPWHPPNPTRVESRLAEIARGGPDPLPKAREIGEGRFSDRVLDAIDRCMVLPETDRIQSCGQLLQRLNSPLLSSDQNVNLDKNAQTPDKEKYEYDESNQSYHQPWISSLRKKTPKGGTDANQRSGPQDNRQHFNARTIGSQQEHSSFEWSDKAVVAGRAAIILGLTWAGWAGLQWAETVRERTLKSEMAASEADLSGQSASSQASPAKTQARSELSDATVKSSTSGSSPRDPIDLRGSSDQSISGSGRRDDFIVDFAVGPGSSDQSISGSAGRGSVEPESISSQSGVFTAPPRLSSSLRQPRSSRTAGTPVPTQTQTLRREESDSARATFTRGSHRDDVLRLQGTPDKISGFGDSELWWYGRSTVSISKRDGLVEEWDDEGNLKVR